MLPQTLEPNERGAAVYTNGEFMGYEDIVTLTEEELYQEQLEAEFNDVHDKAINALNNWGSLTSKQKDTILKNLVKWALWKGGWLKSGTLS